MISNRGRMDVEGHVPQKTVGKQARRESLSWYGLWGLWRECWFWKPNNISSIQHFSSPKDGTQCLPHSRKVLSLSNSLAPRFFWDRVLPCSLKFAMYLRLAQNFQPSCPHHISCELEWLTCVPPPLALTHLAVHFPTGVSCLYVCWYSLPLTEPTKSSLYCLPRILKALVCFYWIIHIALEEAGWDVC